MKTWDIMAMLRAFYDTTDAGLVERFGYGLELEAAAMQRALEAYIKCQLPQSSRSSE